MIKLERVDMKSIAVFNEVLEAADQLTLDEQQSLIEIVNRRLIDRRRSELTKDIQDAQQEFQSGACPPSTPDQILLETVATHEEVY